MIPQQHRQESLHRAYVTAVAAQAGIKATFSTGTEYGVDGEFRRVGEFIMANGTRSFREIGFPIDFQLKSTVGCRPFKNDNAKLSFDCDTTAYNKIVLQNASDTVPILLIVLCLPSDQSQWVEVTENALAIRKACYWSFLQGAQTTKMRTQVIHIPRVQLFTPDALTDIMNQIQTKEGKL